MIEAPTLRVITYQDGDIWVAQCLEHDICVQAPDLNELQLRLQVALQVELEESVARHGAPFVGIGPAPSYFFEKWEQRSGLYTPEPDFLPINGDGAARIEMALCA